ncbi:MULTISPECIES: HAMP domain-containing sensor histidine kinase [unclassified Pseudonocardia]|uniref:sensor histidine kinase n=1 Tax=unclassified Pseudonocardia TaxID=2619320 RepID=UPI001AC547CE|nr:MULTISPECIES: HAMP domain-containing sensor histidine kinase [unclassified Pseudonocardia]MBN9098044.1 HAMP domain-containing histidine kinase [Pseudonocardia sp.]
MAARRGVRAAAAAAAAAIATTTLVVAGTALVLLVGWSLRGAVQSAAEQEARDIAERISGNYMGEPGRNAFEAVDSLARSSEATVQALVDYPQDTGGSLTRVEGSNSESNGRPVTDLRPEDGQTIVRDGFVLFSSNGTGVETVLVAQGTQTLGLPAYVYVAEPLTTVRRTTEELVFSLLVGVPILILVTGIATYEFAGRALRPVEAIRRQVARLTEKDLGKRVPVPLARDEVGRLAKTMNEMLSRLEDAQGVQRRFVADASHELRSPLATIAAGLELMQDGSSTRESDAATVVALRGETERLNRLVDALLLLARADERGLQPRREEVDLDDVADAERVRPGDGGVPAEVHAEPVRVIGDRGQLARVVRNLVDNARRHASTRVLVTVRREGGDAVVEVSDDGAGVPVSDRGRVFERFVRLDDARARSDGGSGLGLAIVAEVVAAHDGSVEIDDAPGGGALFRVRLPTAPAGDIRPPIGGASGPQARPVPPMPVRTDDARQDPPTSPYGTPAQRLSKPLLHG